jgi:hypothetical protein
MDGLAEGNLSSTANPGTTRVASLVYLGKGQTRKATSHEHRLGEHQALHLTSALRLTAVWASVTNIHL